MRKLATLLSFLLAVSVVQAQPINSFLIDNFNNATGLISDSGSPVDGNGSWQGFGPAIPGVVGGNRVLGNYLTNVDPSAGLGDSATRVTAFGQFSIGNEGNVRSSGQVIWQGNSTVPGTNPIISHPAATGFGLGSLDFNTILSTPNFYFQWNVVNSDFRNWTFVIRAYTNDASNYFEGSVTISQIPPSSFTGLLSLPRSAFTAVSGTPSWADIDAISFSANYDFTTGGLGGDLNIDFMQLAVPEMSTYLMLTLMLLLIGAYRAFRSGPAADKKEQAEEKDAQTTPELTPATVTV